MRFLLLSMTVVALAGCAIAGPVYIFVDSVAAPTAEEKRTYHLASGRRGLTVKDPMFRQLSGYAHRALEAAGFQRVEDPDSAEVIILLTYGMSRKRAGNRIQSSSFVTLTGFDWFAVKETGARNAMWTTTAYRFGTAGVIDQTVPKLLRYAAPYIATTTGDVLEIQIN